MYICWTKYQQSVDFSSHYEHFSSLATLVHKQVPPQTIWQRQKSQIFLFLTQTLASPLERQRLLCLCHVGDTPLESPSWVHGGVEETYLALPLFKAVKAQVIILQCKKQISLI